MTKITSMYEKYENLWSPGIDILVLGGEGIQYPVTKILGYILSEIFIPSVLNI